MSRRVYLSDRTAMTNNFMNDKFKNIWTKSRTGTRGFFIWLLVVGVAAFLFATAVTVAGFLYAPALMVPCTGGYSSFIWRTPGLLPVLIGLKLMVLFIVTVAAAFFLRGLVPRFFLPGREPFVGYDFKRTKNESRNAVPL